MSAGDARRQQFECGSVGWSVGETLGEHLLWFWFTCESDEAIGLVALGRPFGYRPTIDVIEALTPDNARVTVALVRAVEPQGVGGTQAHHAGCHEDSRLSSGLPPNSMLADLIQLAESALHAGF